MTPFLIAAAALALAAIAWLTRPLWRGSEAGSKAGAAAIALFLVVVSVAGYLNVGAPDHVAVGPGDAPPPVAAESREQNAEQMAALVDQLAEKMKQRPDDGQGWHMLGRSYAAIGKHAQAADAFRKAAQLKPEDASVLADFAVSLAMSDKAGMQGEPAELVQRALKLDGNNPKALAFAGMVAFDRKDYARAVGYWEHLQKVEPEDSPFKQQIQASIAQARQLAGMQPSAGAASAASPAATAAASTGRVSGSVALSPALNGRVKPGDTVFVFARPAEGPRMPLAVIRKSVSDLPFRFTLDDGMAMSPAAKLSSAGRVVIGARISRSGSATPQPGDLQGFSKVVSVGATDVKVEISEEAGAAGR